MRLLDRYLTRELLFPLAACLGGFLLFWISFDVFSELDEYQSRHLTVPDVALLYAVRLPEFLVLIMPMALLLALLYALTHHARNEELTAIRCAGIGVWRLSVPYLTVGLVFGVTLFAFNELLVPDAADRAERIMTRRQPGAEPGGVAYRNLDFTNQRADRRWHIAVFLPGQNRVKAVDIRWPLPDGTTRHLFAQAGVWTNGGWTFEDVQLFEYNSDQKFGVPRMHDTLSLDELDETPEQIRSEVKVGRLNRFSASKAPELSIREIMDYRRLHPDLNPDSRALLATQFHARLAAPWTCLVVVLIAVPFGAASGRRGAFLGVAGSILIFFGYYILLRFGLALGTGGYVPAWLAAWLPNAVFAASGAWLIRRLP